MNIKLVRAFRFCNQDIPEAPPRDEITIKSFPAAIEAQYVGNGAR